MKISIVIPAYNEERLIRSALRAIFEATEAFASRGWESEVIVCDNNSTDKTGEIARLAGAKVVFEPVNQIARARNRGAAAADGDWLVFVDADSQPSKALFELAAGQIASGGCLAGGAIVQMPTPSRASAFGLKMWNWLSRTMRWMAGSFIFCETSAFREVGGFNQELFAGEELDLSRRFKRLARARGQRIEILTGAPLDTSARKLGLYSPMEFAWFFLRTALTFGRVTRSREQCNIWYDGRR